LFKIRVILGIVKTNNMRTILKFEFKNGLQEQFPFYYTHPKVLEGEYNLDKSIELAFKDAIEKGGMDIQGLKDLFEFTLTQYAPTEIELCVERHNATGH